MGLVPVAQTLPAQLAPHGQENLHADPSKAVLTDYGAESPITRLEDDEAKNVKAWNELPPFGDMQPLGKLKPGAVVLLDSKAGNQESAAARLAALRSRHYLSVGDRQHLAMEDAPASQGPAPLHFLASAPARRCG